jgi:hypothetical protein
MPRERRPANVRARIPLAPPFPGLVRPPLDRLSPIDLFSATLMGHICKRRGKLPDEILFVLGREATAGRPRAQLWIPRSARTARAAAIKRIRSCLNKYHFSGSMTRPLCVPLIVLLFILRKQSQIGAARIIPANRRFPFVQRLDIDVGICQFDGCTCLRPQRRKREVGRLECDARAQRGQPELHLI